MDDLLSSLFDDEIHLDTSIYTLHSSPICLTVSSVHEENQHVASFTSTIFWGGARCLSEIILENQNFIQRKHVIELGFVIFV